jgi:hypothetical protein
MRPRLHLPAGPLRRFRLPPGVARSVRPKQGPRKRAWALVPFSLFVLLTYWLSSGRPLPDVRYWLDGPPRADRGAPQDSRASAPRLEAAPTIAASHVAAETPLTSQPPPPETATALPAKRPKPKPPLTLGRHRLRPVLGWEQASQGEGSSLDSKRDPLHR